MMATFVTITVRGCKADVLEEATRVGFAEMARRAKLLSEWDAESPVSAVSRSAGIKPVAVPPETYEVLEASQAASVATSGAFDATWAALQGLWHFDGPAVLPDPSDVRRQVALVNFRDLVLDPKARTAYLRRSGMRLGLGGLAKGAIAAAGADAVVAVGVPDVLVAASGDIAARGSNGPDPWTVAIQDPRVPEATIATVALHDESLSTAGDYQRCFFIDGHRYHHILDPKTGYPAEGVASVSVIARRGVWADALDTGLLVMGLARGTAAAEGLAGVGALFVDDGGAVRVAGPWARRFVLASRSSEDGPLHAKSTP